MMRLVVHMDRILGRMKVNVPVVTVTVTVMPSVCNSTSNSECIIRNFLSMARNHGHDLFYFLRNLHITLKYGFCSKQ
jgi:hypothetical protein